MNNMELGQVFTRRSVAEYMVSLLKTPKNKAALDPCFGGGAFIDALINGGYTNIAGYEIDEYWANATKAKYPSASLEYGDFLAAPLGRKYDAIIMNPPYIRQEKIDALALYGISKHRLLGDEIYAGLPKSANLYMYFVIKAINLLSENGELVVIFPSSWMQTKTGADFKKHISTACSITDQVHVFGDAFEENALVEVFILRLQKKPTRAKMRETSLLLKDGLLTETTAQRPAGCDFGFSSPFCKIAGVRRGLTTGANSIFINPKSQGDISAYLRPIISSPKSVVGYSTDNAHTDAALIIDEGRGISATLQEYIEKCERAITSSRAPKTLYSKIQRREKWYGLNAFDCSGIIFSYFVRNDMKFVLNTKNHLVRDNFYLIVPGIDPYLAFALLNNYYTYYQLEARGKRYGAGLLKLQRYDIENLVFPDIAAFSAHQLDCLAAGARQLAKTAEPGIVAEITKIIAAATSNDFLKIERMYFQEKLRRLEQKR